MNRKPNLLAAAATLKAKGQQGIPKVEGVDLMDRTLYLNIVATGQGGTVDLVDANTVRDAGITNLDGNKLNAGRDYVIDGIRLLNGGTTANIKGETWVQDILGNYPGALQNAEIVLEQDGNTLIDMPISDIVDASSFEKFRSLSTTPLIRSNLEFTLKIVYPKGQTISSGAVKNIRLEFRVTQAKR